MNPAFSVIFFTTLSGAGFGLWAWLGLRIAFGADPVGFQTLGWLLLLVFAGIAAAAGLLASFWHLGKPLRAWRAFSQWRTSWLSREGVLAVACFVPALALLLLLRGSAPHGLDLAPRLTAAALATLSIATVACTAMIYASLKPIPAWRHRLVVPGYLLFALLTGGLPMLTSTAGGASRLDGALPWLLAGIALAITRDMLDNTVKDAADVEEVTGVGVAGDIPLDKNLRKRAATAFDGRNSATTEAFRKLQTNLQFLNVDNPPRVIVLTSSLSGEGKSTTAINVALALAETDHNVVLVDGDLRCPKLHTYLGLVGTVGFSTVLSGGTTLREALQPTRYPGLTVLTSGPIPPTPNALLGSQSARKVLAQLRADFDYVIVDSAPLLAVTDAAVLAASSDGVLLLTRYGKTKREQLMHSVAGLRNVGAQLLGVCFTMMPPRAGYDNYAYKQYGGAPATGRHAQVKGAK